MISSVPCLALKLVITLDISYDSLRSYSTKLDPVRVDLAPQASNLKEHSSEFADLEGVCAIFYQRGRHTHPIAEQLDLSIAICQQLAESRSR